MIIKCLDSSIGNMSLYKVKLQSSGRRCAMAKLLAMASVLMLVLFIFSPAHADLINNGNNLIYDTDLNITWYNPNIGNMTWDQANIWITSLNTLQMGGVTGWRLPSIVDIFGNNPTSTRNIAESEMRQLYYQLQQLGNTARSELFPNLQPFNYWSSADDPYARDLRAFAFNFGSGIHGYGSKVDGTLFAVLAVYSGNVTAVSNTPVPSAILLLGPGLVSIIAMKRKFVVDHKKDHSS
jgi:hypothetical protein